MGFAPKGSQRVQDFLEKAAEGLVEGGRCVFLLSYFFIFPSFGPPGTLSSCMLVGGGLQIDFLLFIQWDFYVQVLKGVAFIFSLSFRWHVARCT